jgi:hypothetical protein
MALKLKSLMQPTASCCDGRAESQPLKGSSEQKGYKISEGLSKGAQEDHEHCKP